MAIQQRRGKESDLDITKLLPGEIVVPTSGQPAACRTAGDVVRLLTDKDVADLQALLTSLTSLESGLQSLIVDKVGINDAEATTTQAYSGSKTQGIADTLDGKIGSELGTVISVTTNTTTTSEYVVIDDSTKVIYAEIYNPSAQSFESITLPIGLAKYRAKTSGSQIFFITHGSSVVQFSIFIAASGKYNVGLACQNSAVTAGYGIAVWQIK